VVINDKLVNILELPLSSASYTFFIVTIKHCLYFHCPFPTDSPCKHKRYLFGLKYEVDKHKLNRTNKISS
jgi:hypothetical protein